MVSQQYVKLEIVGSIPTFAAKKKSIKTCKNLFLIGFFVKNLEMKNKLYYIFQFTCRSILAMIIIIAFFMVIRGDFSCDPTFIAPWQDF